MALQSRDSNRHDSEFVVLGAGLAGLAAGSLLRERAVVLESEERPGGLVRTHCVDGFWFDHVLHVLYFSDASTETRVRALLGDMLVPCRPQAWAETSVGATRFPFQMHLSNLRSEAVVRCLCDLAKATFGPDGCPARNFEEALLRTFGAGMCDIFLWPYNQKLWKRPLASLSASSLQWTTTRPDFAQVVEGAISNRVFQAYNSAGTYPRPPETAPVRGMEVLTRALAVRTPGLRLQHAVEEIDLQARIIYARTPGGRVTFRFQRACSTLPLPVLMTLCRQTPPSLRERCGRLRHNRVVSVAVCIRGPRPKMGHWRYYADPTVVFNRLVFMHEFDPLSAPPDGFGVLAEITQPAEAPVGDSRELLNRVHADLKRIGVLDENRRPVGAQVFVADPAYVVFLDENAAVVSEALEFLETYQLSAIGRYGRWEYSSMSQVMSDGFSWAERWTK